jgi:predicted ribosome quality control (RQC) complex YloA/Tae2 family protein
LRVEIGISKSLEKNASLYFDAAKSCDKKLRGIEKAVQAQAGRKKTPQAKKISLPMKKRKREWFEQFHWFFTSSGLLVIGGKNAKSNELIVKKHLEEGDIYLHADIEGAASCVVKAQGSVIPESSVAEAAQFAAVFSKAWAQGLASVDVFAVGKEQVSKKAPSGESLSTGAFMIYGKRQWSRKVPLAFAIGAEKLEGFYRAISGPEEAVKKRAVFYARVKLGSLSKGPAAKEFLSRLAKKFPDAVLSGEEVVSMLPGECSID